MTELITDDGDPVAEARSLLEDLTKDLRTAAFDKRQQRAVLQPVIDILRELRKRTEKLKEDHENVMELERMKREVFTLCASLGIRSETYVSGLSELSFSAALSQIRTNIIELEGIKLQRRSRIADIRTSINAIRHELGEAPAHFENGVYGVRSSAPRRSSVREEDVEDLSTAAVESWEDRLRETRKMREGRIKLIRQVAQDIVQLWKDDSKVPSLLDPTLSEVDRKILSFSKAHFTGAQTHIGLDAASLDALVQRKHDLVVSKRERIRTTMEINKRLKLIDDRHVLLNLMTRVEAQARNPLRLFGDSTRLVQEERFRRIAYPRLLLIEAALRPALILYRERHGRPFLYGGLDYLEELDKELKTRVIPREVFPGSSAECTSKLNETDSASDLEMLFGTAGDDGNPYKGLSEALADAMSRTQDDFARVLMLGTKVTDIVAERVAQLSAADIEWMNVAVVGPPESEAQSDELRLLSLGWRLPTTDRDPHVRAAATGNIVAIIAEAKSVNKKASYNESPTRPGVTAATASAGTNAMHAAGLTTPLIPKLFPRQKTADNSISVEIPQALSPAAVSPNDSSLLEPRPPPVRVSPRPCRKPGHPCRSASSARGVSIRGQLSARFSEPSSPRILEANDLIPRCLPNADVKRLRIGPSQIRNIRTPRHLPLALMPAVIAERRRQDEAFKKSSR